MTLHWRSPVTPVGSCLKEVAQEGGPCMLCALLRLPPEPTRSQQRILASLQLLLSPSNASLLYPTYGPLPGLPLPLVSHLSISYSSGEYDRNEECIDPRERFPSSFPLKLYLVQTYCSRNVTWNKGPPSALPTCFPDWETKPHAAPATPGKHLYPSRAALQPLFWSQLAESPQGFSLKKKSRPGAEKEEKREEQLSTDKKKLTHPVDFWEKKTQYRNKGTFPAPHKKHRVLV